MEAQYGIEANEEWFAGKVMAVNAEGTCDVHYENGDKEAGKPWSRVRAAAVDAESEETGELEEEGGGQLGQLEEGRRGGQNTEGAKTKHCQSRLQRVRERGGTRGSSKPQEAQASW